MELAQISLRTTRELAERVKAYAKAHKLSVNSFLEGVIENTLNNMDSGGEHSELTHLVAAPLKTLSRLHYKISDPWDTNEMVKASDVEKAFLIDAAKKQLDSKYLTGPFYDTVRERLVAAHLEDDPELLRLLFGFALRYYIKDESAQRVFATENAPIGIPTAKYEFTVGSKTFIVIIQGNEGNLTDTPENNRPPKLTFICETAQFDSRHDWDTFIALVRLMDAVYAGKASECHKGTHTHISKRNDKELPWSLHLGRLQLLFKENELMAVAEGFNKLVKNDAASIIKQIRLLYGEG